MDDLSWIEFFFSSFPFSRFHLLLLKKDLSLPRTVKICKKPQLIHPSSCITPSKKRNISPNTKTFKSKKTQKIPLNSPKYHSRTRMSKPFLYLQDKQTLLKPCKVILNLKSNFETKLCNCIQCILFYFSHPIYNFDNSSTHPVWSIDHLPINSWISLVDLPFVSGTFHQIKNPPVNTETANTKNTKDPNNLSKYGKNKPTKVPQT